VRSSNGITDSKVARKLHVVILTRWVYEPSGRRPAVTKIELLHHDRRSIFWWRSGRLVRWHYRGRRPGPRCRPPGEAEADAQAEAIRRIFFAIGRPRSQPSSPSHDEDGGVWDIRLHEDF
jgi:hypothetical protein